MQQHGLHLVRKGVRCGDAVRLAVRQLLKEGIPHLAPAFLKAEIALPRLLLYIRMQDAQRDSVFFAPAPDHLFVLIGRASAQAVVDMGSQHLQIGVINEKMGKRHRVGPTGQADNHPALRWEKAKLGYYPFDLA